MRSMNKTKGIILLICSVLVISLIVFRQYIFGNYYFFNNGMLSDIVRANVPAYYQLYDAIFDGGSLLWSFKMGVGTSMFSHADILFDPFTYIVFLGGRDNICDMLIWMFIIKILVESVAVYIWLNSTVKNSFANIIASILYAFSGYSLIMGSNFALGTILVYIPFILLGTDQLIKDKRIGVLFISLLFTCLYSYYYFYSVAIGLIIYVIYKTYDNKQLLWQVLKKGILLGISVILCSMVALLPQIELVSKSSRVNKEMIFDVFFFLPNIKTLFTLIIKSVSSDALGNAYSSSYYGDSYSTTDYFGHSLYFGSFFILFLVLWYRNTSKKNRILIITAILASCIPAVGYFFNGCSTINSRFLYWASLFEAYVVAKGIDICRTEKDEFWKSYAISVVVLGINFLGVIILSINKQGLDILSELCNSLLASYRMIFILYIAIFALGIYQSILYSKCEIYKKSRIIIGFIILITTVDICNNYNMWYGSEYCVTEYTEENNFSYHDSSMKVINQLKKNDKGFYRINKMFDSVITNTVIDSMNDSMVQKYYGLKNYNSLGNPGYIDFLRDLGCYVTLPVYADVYRKTGVSPWDVEGQELNYIAGVGDRYNLMSYLGVKYILSKEQIPNLPECFMLDEYSNNIYVYKNSLYMPLVFCNEDIIYIDDFLQLSDSLKEQSLLTSTIVEDKNAMNNNGVYKWTSSDIAENVRYNQNSCKIKTFKEDNITVDFNIPNSGKYMSTTIPYDSNWTVYIDGKKVDTLKVNCGFLGFRVDKLYGNHEIEIKYELKSLVYGSIISLFAFILFVTGVIYKTFKADYRVTKSY